MLRDYLSGFEAHAPQTVGNMTVIPLVSQSTEYSDVGTVADLYLERDRAYDKLTIGNQSGKVTVVPNGYTLITKEAAQDRAVRSKELIKSGKSREVSAFCVQSSQGGFMRKTSRDHQVARMLPATVRREAHLNRNSQGYSGLWGTLETYNTSMGLSGDFLRTFFDKYCKQLDEFVAEFELVEHQRGAIILINDEIVGVEISPNPMAFSAQWEMLIRDCYGSEAVARQSETQTVDETAILGDAATLEDLEDLLDKFEEGEYDYVEDKVHKILSQNETMSVRQTEEGLSVVDMETEDYVGQAVKNGGIIDLTLLARDVAQKGFKFARSRRGR